MAERFEMFKDLQRPFGCYLDKLAYIFDWLR